MHLTPFGSFVASRHAEVSLLLRDKRFGKDFVERSRRRYGPKIMEEPVFRILSHTMLQADPPDHTRLRGLVVKAFTARRVDDEVTAAAVTANRELVPTPFRRRRASGPASWFPGGDPQCRS